MKRTDLNIAQRIWLEILWRMARLFAAMPYWFKFHVVENLLFFVLCYCLRYRMQVVRRNLRNSFPEKSDDKGRSILQVEGLEEHLRKVGGRDWIAMTAHFGCWEYCSFWGFYAPTQIVVAVYHPLRSKVAEALYQRLRNGDYATTVSMKESLRFYLRHRDKGFRGKNLVMGLIADQNPPRRPDSHWFRFLNQDTIFFDGGEKLALRCRLPVYFVRMDRLQRGRYRMSFVPLYDGEEQVAPNELTERYVRELERVIRERPELWMWSHRRWKHKRMPDAER